MAATGDADPFSVILGAIQERRIGQALAALEGLVGASGVDHARLLVAVESLYGLEDGMTREQQDRVFRLERGLRAGRPARP